MKQYFTGFFTGACLVASTVMFMEASDKNEVTHFKSILADTIVLKGAKTTAIVNSEGIIFEGDLDSGKSLALLHSTGMELHFNDVIRTKVLHDLISINDKNGKSKTIISTNNQGGFLRTLNADGKETVYLGTMHEGYGALGTFNADGKHTAYLGDGNLQTYNKHGVKLGYFGAGKSGDGIILLNDRYGDDGWDESGKQ